MVARQLLALALLCVALEPSVACRRCTRIACSTGMQIELLPPFADGRFANGSYVLTWVSDDDMDTCEFEVVDDERCENTNPAACVVEPSCASAVDHHGGRITMFFETTPESLQVTVERDGAVRSDTEHEPVYEETDPDGPGCTPGCREATIEIPVGSP